MIGTGYFAQRHLAILTSEPNIEVVGHVAAIQGQLCRFYKQ